MAAVSIAKLKRASADRRAPSSFDFGRRRYSRYFGR